MSAGRNLITLFFTVNTLLQFFFWRRFRVSLAGDAASTGNAAGRRTRTPPTTMAFAKKHFFSAVFFICLVNARGGGDGGRRRHARLASARAGCPPAENFFSDEAHSGVAQAQMRKLSCSLARPTDSNRTSIVAPMQVQVHDLAAQTRDETQASFTARAPRPHVRLTTENRREVRNWATSRHRACVVGFRGGPAPPASRHVVSSEDAPAWRSPGKKKAAPGSGLRACTGGGDQ